MLPAIDDVCDGLARYLDAVERADESDERIARTDAPIDGIVYDLYGPTGEERGIVGAAVGD
ncbi:MAG: hypothetical protein ABEH40_08360 [Haloferacaceae archaeon]